MTRILITGGGGFLGRRLWGALTDHPTLEPVALLRRAPAPGTVPAGSPWEAVDLTDRAAVREAVDRLEPEIIVHTAALTDVDRCEAESQLAWEVNTCGTAHLAAAAAGARALLVYISTDYVFDGNRRFYREDDAPRPCNWYGVTKRAGEIATTLGCADHAIIRTTFFGMRPDGRGLFNRVVGICGPARGGPGGGTDGGHLALAADRFSSPLAVGALVRAVVEVAERGLTGTFHLGGTTRCSPYEFARAVAGALDLTGAEAAVRLLPVSAALPSTPPTGAGGTAVRPVDVSLAVDKARRTLRCGLPSLEEGVGEEIRSVFP